MGAFWIILSLVVLLVVILSVIYLISRIGRFSFVNRLAGGFKKKKRLLATFIFLVSTIILSLTMGVINMGVCIIYLMFIWLICDGISLLCKKISGKIKKNIAKKCDVYCAGICAIILTVIYLVYAWNVAHNVKETNYIVKTDKEIGEDLRIAYFADSHLGTTFDGVGFVKELKKLQETNPDVLFIVGDFVDDDSVKEDMLTACKALGEFKAKYGIYYVCGNHDKGYYNNPKRGFTYDELITELRANNVIVLQDEVTMVDDRFYIVGRQDKEVSDRLDMEKLTEFLNPNKFCIVLDHQPADYDAQEKSGVDMVLSGHTHGGQLFPFNKVGEWTGVNCMVYGQDKRSNTDFIVTSGISDWAIKFKSGCKAEFVVIDVTGK